MGAVVKIAAVLIPRPALPLLAGLALLGATGAGPAAAVLGPAPAPRADAWILVDPATDEVLASRAADRALPMASTTKMMTALVVRENAGLDEMVTVPAEAILSGTSAQLVPGEQISVRDLLTGLMVASGNDAAMALAVHVGGSEEGFVEMMNAAAREMGLDHTRFTNPHGLDEPGHAASVRDLVTIGEAVMSDPVLAPLAGSRTATIAGPGGVGTRFLESKNELLDIDPDADGIKTGMTDGAGYSLVAHAERDSLGTELYAALIGSPGEAERAEDAKELLDWGFAQFARPTVLASGATLGEAEVTGRPGAEVGLVSAKPITATVRLDEPIEQRLTAPPRVDPPMDAGEQVGSIVYVQDGRELGRSPVVLAESAGEPSLWDRVRAGFGQLIP